MIKFHKSSSSHNSSNHACFSLTLWMPQTSTWLRSNSQASQYRSNHQHMRHQLSVLALLWPHLCSSPCNNSHYIKRCHDWLKRSRRARLRALISLRRTSGAWGSMKMSAINWMTQMRSTETASSLMMKLKRWWEQTLRRASGTLSCIA